ncbi:hypothetical protein LEL_07416 [Akanthomyces lecanii RCEF 1005]|uniref:Uncharacterized protein n=1 Tax=Akanthomyces lecanii RCEF 1005 TaxID=1081108 RepID=A0A162KIJ7_CORDF|nr:hypothetical protein LEL_07416 [Akanthomyces lecanii RCEF 1005]
MSNEASDDGYVYSGGMSEDERGSQCGREFAVADAELARSTSVDAENDDSNTPDAMEGVENIGNNTVRGAVTGLEERMARLSLSGEFADARNGDFNTPDAMEGVEHTGNSTVRGAVTGLEECMARLSLSDEKEVQEEEVEESDEKAPK